MTGGGVFLCHWAIIELGRHFLIHKPGNSWEWKRERRNKCNRKKKRQCLTSMIRAPKVLIYCSLSATPGAIQCAVGPVRWSCRLLSSPPPRHGTGTTRVEIRSGTPPGPCVGERGRALASASSRTLACKKRNPESASCAATNEVSEAEPAGWRGLTHPQPVAPNTTPRSRRLGAQLAMQCWCSGASVGVMCHEQRQKLPR
ncbi:hypothetical protein GGR52DRAFT_247517 [Hypoxylon sp. FL1284]|nr:hypothetical protein GGR52DRAFT_247517 [Hypoxylon sp. FL1284]